MSSNSTIKFKRLKGTVQTISYNCAQDVKDLHRDMAEYTFIAPELPTNMQVRADKWYQYLIDMGLPLSVNKANDGTNEINIDDVTYPVDGRHLLWIHGLIRAPQEHESGFSDVIDITLYLRTLDEVKHLDHYQLIQLAMMYQNRITEDTAAYSHWPLATYAADMWMPTQLITINEVAQRIFEFGNNLGLAKSAIVGQYPSSMIEEIKQKYPKFETDYGTSTLGYFFDMALPSKVTNAKKPAIRAAIPVLLEYFEIQAKYKLPTHAICTNIGTASTLIKHNVYLIKKMGRNKNLITVQDAWGQEITSRHFKIIA